MGNFLMPTIVTASVVNGVTNATSLARKSWPVILGKIRHILTAGIILFMITELTNYLKNNTNENGVTISPQDLNLHGIINLSIPISIAALGLYGSLAKSAPSLRWFMILVTIHGVYSLVIVFYHNHNVDETQLAQDNANLVDKFRNAMKNYRWIKDNSSNSNIEVNGKDTLLWDGVQSLGCCGLEDPSDWDKVRPINFSTNLFPQSCCAVANCTILIYPHQRLCNKKDIYQEGCLSRLETVGSESQGLPIFMGLLELMLALICWKAMNSLEGPQDYLDPNKEEHQLDGYAPIRPDKQSPQDFYWPDDAGGLVPPEKQSPAEDFWHDWVKSRLVPAKNPEAEPILSDQNHPDYGNMGAENYNPSYDNADEEINDDNEFADDEHDDAPHDEQDQEPPPTSGNVVIPIVPGSFPSYRNPGAVQPDLTNNQEDRNRSDKQIEPDELNPDEPIAKSPSSKPNQAIPPRRRENFRKPRSVPEERKSNEEPDDGSRELAAPEAVAKPEFNGISKLPGPRVERESRLTPQRNKPNWSKPAVAAPDQSQPEETIREEEPNSPNEELVQPSAPQERIRDSMIPQNFAPITRPFKIPAHPENKSNEFEKGNLGPELPEEITESIGDPTQIEPERSVPPSAINSTNPKRPSEINRPGKQPTNRVPFRRGNTKDLTPNDVEKKLDQPNGEANLEPQEEESKLANLLNPDRKFPKRENSSNKQTGQPTEEPVDAEQVVPVQSENLQDKKNPLKPKDLANLIDKRKQNHKSPNGAEESNNPKTGGQNRRPDIPAGSVVPKPGEKEPPQRGFKLPNWLTTAKKPTDEPAGEQSGLQEPVVPDEATSHPNEVENGREPDVEVNEAKPSGAKGPRSENRSKRSIPEESDQDGKPNGSRRSDSSQKVGPDKQNQPDSNERPRSEAGEKGCQGSNCNSNGEETAKHAPIGPDNTAPSGKSDSNPSGSDRPTDPSKPDASTGPTGIRPQTRPAVPTGLKWPPGSKKPGASGLRQPNDSKKPAVLSPTEPSVEGPNSIKPTDEPDREAESVIPRDRKPSAIDKLKEAKRVPSSSESPDDSKPVDGEPEAESIRKLDTDNTLNGEPEKPSENAKLANLVPRPGSFKLPPRSKPSNSSGKPPGPIGTNSQGSPIAPGSAPTRPNVNPTLEEEATPSETGRIPEAKPLGPSRSKPSANLPSKRDVVPENKTKEYGKPAFELPVGRHNLVDPVDSAQKNSTEPTEASPTRSHQKPVDAKHTGRQSVPRGPAERAAREPDATSQIQSRNEPPPADNQLERQKGEENSETESELEPEPEKKLGCGCSCACTCQMSS